MAGGPGLLKFFKPCRKNSCDLPLPDPNGVLKEKVDSSAIEEANKEVSNVITDSGGKRNPYLKLTPEHSCTFKPFPNDGHPTILINVISTYTAARFEFFHSSHV